MCLSLSWALSLCSSLSLSLSLSLISSLSLSLSLSLLFVSYFVFVFVFVFFFVFGICLRKRQNISNVRQNICNAVLGSANGFFSVAPYCDFMLSLLLCPYRSSLRSFQSKHMCSLWNERKEER